MKKDKTMVREIKEVIGKELRGFRQEFSAFKQEMSNQFNDFKQEIGGQFKGFRQEFSGFKQEVNQKIDSGIDEAKRHAGVLAEGLRSEVKIIAEQHSDIMRKLEEHDKRFDEVDGRFDQIDIRFNRVDIDLKAMNNALFDNSHRLNDHDVRIRKLETR